MLPAGIISSGVVELAVAALVPAPGGVKVGAAGEPGTAGSAAAASTGAGRLVAVVAAGLLVASANRNRTGARRVGAGVFPGGVWAQTSRAVKNKIRASVVVFILPLRLQVSNCRRTDFSGSWRPAGCWRRGAVLGCRAAVPGRAPGSSRRRNRACKGNPPAACRRR